MPARTFLFDAVLQCSMSDDVYCMRVYLCVCVCDHKSVVLDKMHACRWRLYMRGHWIFRSRVNIAGGLTLSSSFLHR